VAWTEVLNRRTNREGVELQKMILGIEILLHNIPKMVLLVVVAWFLGILPQALITFLPFAVIRGYASGLHANNAITCTIVTLLMFVAAPYALQGVYISAALLLIVFALVGIGMFMYAPADTAARPILGRKKRARLKKKAVLSTGVMLAAALALGIGFDNPALYSLFAVGAVYALIMILPLTYKLLGKSMNNYAGYEQGLAG